MHSTAPIYGSQQVTASAVADTDLEEVIGGGVSNTVGQDYWPWPQRPRPPSSMRDLAALALVSLPGQKGDLNELIAFVTRCFPYYRKDNKWHRSLANALYDNNNFVKLQREGMATNYKYTFSDKFRAVFDARSVKEKLKAHMDPDCWILC